MDSSRFNHEMEHVQPIVPQEDHTILYDLKTLTGSQPPKPYEKLSKNNKLNLNFVHLPCLKSNVFWSPDPENGGGYASKPIWPLIKESLSQEIRSSYDLQRAISRYNKDVGEFKALHAYCEHEHLNRRFFEEILPAIIELALQLPALVKSGIPLLKHGLNHSISLSQEQIACLLANAFLCTFPEKRSQGYSGKFPDINFNRLFQSDRYRVIEKIKCIVNYFERVTKNMPIGVLTFIRRSKGNNHLPVWSQTKLPLSETTLNIYSNGTIEEQRDLLQVDFANKYIGGGVLGGGCVQEEIRFIICPELIISRLFTEFLKDNEALIVAGAEQFSNYTGYAGTFEFAGNHKDDTPFERGNQRRRCYIVAIDALNFSNPSSQYEEWQIKRELNKAYVGFHHPLKDAIAPGVATGNWGCGAFKGDPQLKSLIQLMACTVNGRPLHYFTFGNTSLHNSLYDIYNYLTEKNINTLQLWKYMNEYKDHSKRNEDLFTFIKRRHEGRHKEHNHHDTNSKNCHKSCAEEIPNNSKQEKSTSSNSKNKQTYAGVTKNEQNTNLSDVSMEDLDNGKSELEPKSSNIQTKVNHFNNLSKSNTSSPSDEKEKISNIQQFNKSGIQLGTYKNDNSTTYGAAFNANSHEKNKSSSVNKIEHPQNSNLSNETSRSNLSNETDSSISRNVKEFSHNKRKRDSGDKSIFTSQFPNNR